MLKGSNKNILFGFAGVTVVLFLIFVFGEVVKIPKTIDSYAQIYPHSKWVLSTGTAGQINSSLMDFTHGFSSSYQTTQFDRGEDISFLFDKSLSNKHNIEAGDTIIRIKSSQIQERIILAQGELAVAKANLLSQSTGDKTELVNEATSNLEFSKTKVVQKKSLFDRADQLFKKGLISQEEYDTQKWELKLLEIEVEVNKSKLEALKTGVKQEQVQIITSQIEALNSQLKFLFERAERLYILSPIGGIVSQSFSPDTLLTVLKMDEVMLNIPVKLSDVNNFKRGTNSKIELGQNHESIIGKTISISNEVQIMDGNQVVFARMLIKNPNEKYLSGMVLPCRITLDKISLKDYLFDVVLN